MRVTLAQIAPKLNRSNLSKIVDIITEFQGESDLIVFPELALNGYLLQDKLFEDAYSIHELDILKDMSRDVDIVVGVALRDKNIFRNAALYFSNGSLVSKHYKVHLPNYGMFEEARYFEAGNVFESFVLNGKKISMLVCEDLWHTTVHKDLIEENPDFIIALVASPARGFSDNGLEIEHQWQEIIQKVAKECSAQLLFVNRVGFEDGLGFWGGSCIIDDAGKEIYRLEKFVEKIETYEMKDSK